VLVSLQIEYIGVYKGGLNMETISVGEFPVYGAFIMLVIDCFLYSLLAIYFSMVIEGTALVMMFCVLLLRDFKLFGIAGNIQNILIS